MLSPKTLALLLLAAGLAPQSLPHHCVSAFAQDQQQNVPQPAVAQPSPEPTPPQSSTPAKPAPKPKHVITNDDIQPSPYASFGGLFYVNTGSINDCDSNCFDQLRMYAQVDITSNPNWRRDLLQQIEAVRSDSEWQSYLRDLYGAHGKICQLNFDKMDEMRRTGSTRNLGPLEIAIVEKYDNKTKAAQADLDAQVARQSTLQKKFKDKPFAYHFANLQTLRIRGGFCSQARVIYPQ